MNLQWNDLKSQTMIPIEYLEKFKNKTEVKNSYKNYNPNIQSIEDIENILKRCDIILKILVIGAEWCPDCSIHIPQMIKIVEKIKLNELELKILYGVKVNPYHKKGDIIWHKKKSPPEASDSKFDLQKIPTFYIFNFQGELLGKIIEHPKNFDTMEEELLNILKINLSK